MAHAARSGWGYRIDYDKEIANDLKEIAVAERHVPLSQVLTAEERAVGDWHLDLVSFLFRNVEQRAPLLGLSTTDVADLWWYCDLNSGTYDYDAPEPAKGWYGRGKAIDDRLRQQYDQYVLRDPQKLLKKLRGALSRHRRNKVRFG